jgi:hypothetical protein
MKLTKLALLALLLTAPIMPSLAQAQTTIAPIFSIGPAFFIGTPPEGRESNIRLGYNLGLQYQIAGSSEMGFTLGLAYDDRAMKFTNTADATKSTITDFHYITLLPGIYWHDLTLGLGVGLPLGAAVSENLSTTLTDLNKSDINTLFEIRVGAAIPVLMDKNGAGFSLLLTGTMPILEALSTPHYLQSDGITKSTLGNGRVATLRAGISYAFGL